MHQMEKTTKKNTDPINLSLITWSIGNVDYVTKTNGYYTFGSLRSNRNVFFDMELSHSQINGKLLNTRPFTLYLLSERFSKTMEIFHSKCHGF